MREHISGFVTCVFGAEWWLACVLEHNQEEHKVKLTIVHPAGPKNSLWFPNQENIGVLRVNDILALIDPKTRSD